MTGSGLRRAASSLPLSALFALLLCLLVAAPAAATGAPAASNQADRNGADRGEAPPRAAKVVIIVGPTGSLTASFLREAEAAAAIARRHSTDVTTIYTPHATWAAVKPALQGADIVIYLGHGNGWPSIYRDSLYLATQNGLGLNPVAGGGDDVHRYYGERFLARDVKLAPGAIVLLHHLCYAAGNSEPGLPEGPHDVAKQRVENYAAGWLAAGADAVVAEAYLGPAYYVRSLFETRRSVERIWRSSPTFKGNVEAWPSNRTADATALIDPYVVAKRYGRSLVLRGDPSGPATAGEAPSDGVLPPEALPPPPPLAGAALAAPVLSGPIVEGTTVELSLPIELPDGAKVPEGLLVEASWWPLEVPAAEEDESAEPEAGSQPFLSETEPASVTVTEAGLAATLQTPPLAGAYELRVALHSADGSPLTDEPGGLEIMTTVSVARPLSAAFSVPEVLQLVAGQAFSLPIGLSNSGNVGWAQDPDELLDELGPQPVEVVAVEEPRLVGRLVRLGIDEIAKDLPTEPVLVAPATVEPGQTLELTLNLVAPETSGTYVLMLDVETPAHGPLALRGNPLTAVMLEVAPAPAPLATPGTD
ncbi:MAG TPA: hypothetical protein VMP67_11640 [Candidatus Limnocylindria bacterium]|nr:hypothetical protein [Candidatus Limnocylindria bacterium]